MHTLHKRSTTDPSSIHQSYFYVLFLYTSKAISDLFVHLFTVYESFVSAPHACVVLRGAEEESHALELEWQVVESHLSWMLVTELWSSA